MSRVPASCSSMSQVRSSPGVLAPIWASRSAYETVSTNANRQPESCRISAICESEDVAYTGTETAPTHQMA